MTANRSRRRARRRRARRALAWAFAGAGASYLAASWATARGLAERLISPRGLGPAPTNREGLIQRLRATGARVEDYRHRGSPLSPVELAAIFASPGEPSRRPTIVFLHGKGGGSPEWEPDAVRAVAAGYNVLVPDLRGHPPSQGEFVTYGLLEKDDLANAIDAARERFGMDSERLGVHSCSAGSAIALEFCASNDRVRALWLESPFADPRQMARHYLSVSTGLPQSLLTLTSRWAIRRVVRRIRTELAIAHGEGLDGVDPLVSAARVRARVCVVYGARDLLVPPTFVARLLDALPDGTCVWHPSGAGHCHHPDEAAKVEAAEYERRWREFFAVNLPGAEGESSHDAVPPL